MEVRPYLTAGAAIVTTGALVVATPALVPAPTPPDVRISATAPRSVYADVALKFTTQELLNAIFSGFPDTEGPRGLVGVALLLARDASGEDSPLYAFVEGGIVGLARSFFPDETVAAAFLDGGIVGVLDLLTTGVPVVNSFVNDGIVGVADELTTGIPLVNSFFGGFTEDGPTGIVGVLDELTAGSPQANAFITGGIVGLARSLVADDTLEAAFLDGGIVSATEFVLVQAAGGPDTELGIGIRSFFSGYPPEIPANEEDPAVPAGPAGIVGLVHFLLDALTGGIQGLPEEETPVEGASVPEVGTTLLAASTGPVDTQDLPEANETTLTRSALTFNLNVATDPTTGVVDPADTLDPADTTDPTTVETTDPVALDPVDTTEPVETTDPDPTVTPVGATTPGSGSGSLPVGQPPVDPTTPPTTDPVVDPEPTDPVANEEEGEEGEESAEEQVKSGNKFEPTPILLQNGRGGGASGWDETVQRWKDFGNKLGLGGAPAPSAPTGGGAPAAGEDAEGS